MPLVTFLNTAPIFGFTIAELAVLDRYRRRTLP
jgi:hypothetical protein